VPLKQIMQFTVGTAAGFSPPAGTPAANLATATLRSGAQAIQPLTPTPGAVRNMFLNEVIDPVTATPAEVLLNNLTFKNADGTSRTAGIATPKLNTVEVWQIVNTTMDAHPIHLHLTQFQVLNRQNIDSAAYLAAVNPNLPNPSAGGTGVLGSNGSLPPPDDDYFAALGYMDMTHTMSVSHHIGTFELNLYRVIGMSAFYAISYARYPSRLIRTFRNVRANRSATVLEQRLVEYQRRRRGGAPNTDPQTPVRACQSSSIAPG